MAPFACALYHLTERIQTLLKLVCIFALPLWLIIMIELVQPCWAQMHFFICPPSPPPPHILVPIQVSCFVGANGVTITAYWKEKQLLPWRAPPSHAALLNNSDIARWCWQETTVCCWDSVGIREVTGGSITMVSFRLLLYQKVLQLILGRVWNLE